MARIDFELVEHVADLVARNFHSFDRPLVPSICRRLGVENVVAIYAIRRAAEIRPEQAKGARHGGSK
ncbi:hypothetical protein [Mesorhizobium sp. M1143]|uniref:hypothetical protein n=1 Tax=Mesorhizobium sp. M1143 TaxID=2957061 RepID=UPI003336E41D